MAIDIDPAAEAAGYADPSSVVTSAWLSARLGTKGLKVVESNADSLLYNIGHIPGAVRIDWRNDLNNPVSRDFITGEQFAKLMSDKGIARTDTVVIYGDKANWWAAYTLWVFKLFGHPDVRLLDGGRDGWMGEERDTSFDVPMYPVTDYPVVERDDATFRIFAEEIRGLLGGATQLVDVRDPDTFAGVTDPEPAALRSGHIPGAVNFPWSALVDANSRFRPLETIREHFSGLDATADTVTYCHLGDRSSLTWFVLKYLLGFSAVRNYDGSWSEWGNTVRVPIERENSE